MKHKFSFLNSAWCIVHSALNSALCIQHSALRLALLFVLMLGVGEAWGDTWTLVTSTSELNAGGVYVIACNTQGTTAGNISSQVMTQISSTFSTNKSTITSLGSNTVELTLGGSTGAWTFTSSSGLLKATAVKKLAWGGSSGTGTWSISISSDGNATITNGTSSYGTMKYNSNSPRFTTYASGQTSVQLYKKSAQTTVTLTAGNNGYVKAYSDAERQTELKVDANNQFKVNQNTTVYFTATPSSSSYVVDSWSGATADAQDNTKASLAVGTDATKIVSVSFTTASQCTAITPSISYNTASVKEGLSSVAPTISGNTGEGAVTYSILSGSAYADINTSTGVVTAKTAGAGSVVVQASIAASGDYCQATCSTTVSVVAATISASSNDTELGTVQLSGKVITASPKSGSIYADPAYTVLEGNAQVSQNGNEFTVTPAGDCSVQINFASKGCTDHGGSAVTTGTTNSYSEGPLNTYYNYSTRQILYTKTDLNLVSGKKGTIKSIYFEYNYETALSCKSGVKIYMANTNLTALSASSCVPYSSFTEVYSGALNCSKGWNEFTLTKPFTYNGTGNLVVLIDDNSGACATMSNVFKCNASTNSQIHKYSDSENVDPSKTDWSGFTTSNNRPNTKFCIQEADMTTATVTWYVNSVSKHSQTAYPGTTCTAPSPTPTTSDCDGSKIFVGWTATPIATSTDDPPTDLFTDPTTKTIPDGGASYYAVFADSDGTEEQTIETIGFEYSEGYSSGSTYNSSSYTTGSKGSKWTINYGAFATGGAIVGSQSAQFRIYNSGGGFGQLYNSVAYASDIVKVTFSAKTANTNGGVKVSYSGNGSSWTEIETKSLTTSLAEYTTTVPSSGARYIKFTATGNRPNSGNYSIYVDAVKPIANVASYSNYVTSCCTKHNITLTNGGSKQGTDSVIGTFSATPMSACAGTEITLAANPKKGYTFTGWTTSPEQTISNNKFEMPAEAVTVDATFALQKHNVILHKNDGVPPEATDATEYTYGETKALKSRSTLGWTRDGYNFDGWSFTTDGSIAYTDGANFTLEAEQDVNLYAKWSPDNVRTVSYFGDAQLNYTTKPEQISATDASFTATYTVAAHNQITAVVVTVGDAALTASEIEFDQTHLKVTPTSGFTGAIAVTFTVAPIMRSVTWMVNGTATTAGDPTTSVQEGQKVAKLPTDPESCDENTMAFRGWTNSTIDDQEEAPAGLFADAASAPVVEGNVTYHAVFAEKKSGSGAFDPSKSGEYYIAAIDKHHEQSDPDVIYYSVGKPSSTDTYMSGTSDAAGASAYLFEKGTGDNVGKFAIKIDNVYVTYAPGSQSSQKTWLGTSEEPYYWTISAGSVADHGSYNIVSATSNRSLTYQSYSGDNPTHRFAGYSTTNITAQRDDYYYVELIPAAGSYAHYSTTCVPPVEAPTLTETGTACGTKEITISQSQGLSGLKIYYNINSDDDPTSSSNEYTEPFSVTENSTVKAIAICGPKSSAVASATYTILTKYTLATATSAATADAKIGCLTFENVLVNARTASEAFMVDANGTVILVNKSSHGLQVGDMLSATNAQLSFAKSNNLLQLQSLEGVDKVSGQTVTPIEKTIGALTAADYGKLVIIKGLTYDKTNTRFTLGEASIAANGKFYVGGSIPSSWTDGAQYDVTGIVLVVDETIVIAPRNNDDLQALATPLNAPANLQVTSLTSTSVAVSWDAVEHASSYSVYIYDADEKEVVKSENRQSTSYAPTTKLTAASTYTWKVYANGDNISYAKSPAATSSFTTYANAKLIWMNGDTKFAETNAVNDKVVLPTGEKPVSGCSDLYQDFICWVKEPISGVQTTKITQAQTVTAETAAPCSTTVAAEYTYYAAFGKIDQPADTNFVKVTEAPKDAQEQIDWTGDYLMVNGTKAFNSGASQFDADNNYIELNTIKNDSVPYTQTTADAMFHIYNTGTDNQYWIMTSDWYYIGNGSKSNGLSFSQTTGYVNSIALNNNKVTITALDNEIPTYLSYLNSNKRFRYYADERDPVTLYKYTEVAATYSAYITSCPQTYTVTEASVSGGQVSADPKTKVEAGTKVTVTANPSAGYTTGTWDIYYIDGESQKQTLTPDKNSQITMPAADVTVSYNFTALVDKFVDNLHDNTTIEKSGAQYTLPDLENVTAGTLCNKYYFFAGWIAGSYNSGEPVDNDDEVLTGAQNATGATYNALWWDGDKYFITECCNTDVPTEFKSLPTYLKATSAKLDWNNVTGATKYHVLVLDNNAETIIDVDVDKSEYELKGLTANTTYAATVKAYKGCWGFETGTLEFTTAAEIQRYAVSINASNGTYDITPALDDKGKIEEGQMVTIYNCVADPHYHFTGVTSNDVEISGNESSYTFTMPSKAITVNINFVAIPAITWKVEGSTVATTYATPASTNFTVGTMQAAPTEWSYKDEFYKDFAGWLIGEDVEKPVFATAGTAVTENVTLNAAFAKSAEIDFDNLVKIESNENLDFGAQYIIGGEKTVGSVTTTNYFYLNDQSGSKGWGKMSDDVENNKPILLSISGSASELAVRDADGNYMNGSAAKNFKMDETEHYVALNDNGKLVCGDNMLRYSTSDNGMRWYSTEIGVIPDLYKAAMTYDYLTIAPAEQVKERTLKVDEYSTICLEQGANADDIFGISLWTIEKATWSNDKLYSITIVQNEGDMVAGMPYIICGEGEVDKRFIVTSGDKVDNPISDDTNGLHGSFVKVPFDNIPGYNPENSGYYVISNGTLYLCGSNSGINDHRAYIKADEITDQSSQSAPAAVRRTIGGKNTPTLLENIFGNGDAVQKLIINEQLIIIRNGKMYNAEGALVK